MLIRQKHPHGCGVACLAMVTGDEYDAVFAAMQPYIGQGRGIHEFHIRDYLNARGFAYQQVPAFKALTDAKRDPWPPAPWAPVHIVQASDHFVVMDAAGRVFDPARGERESLTFPEYGNVYFVLGIWRVP